MQPTPSLGDQQPTRQSTRQSTRTAVTIDESEVVRRYSGSVAWPTVVLCLVLVAGYSAVIVGWATGVAPLWAGFVVNAAITYAFYTVHHDANHKAISGRHTRWRWLDTACGSIAAIPLQLSFKGWSVGASPPPRVHQ